MKLSRRRFGQFAAAGALLPAFGASGQTVATDVGWHQGIARRAAELDKKIPLQLIIPDGSSANVLAGTRAFTEQSGVTCQITEVPVDEINLELTLRASARDTSVDVGLPATFGVPDLVEAGAIAPLDDFAARYEPAGYSTGHLYRNGDHYQGRLYGYQTDGDAYLLFYNKRMLESPVEQARFKALTGRPLTVAKSWEELDELMAFFHRPEQEQYGGALFRNPGYLAWEWWARFHAKGYYPFSDDMTPNVNNAAGVSALEELIEASAYLTPNSELNGLFENWEEFATGRVFCNIGWGGTQKFLMSTEAMRDNLVHTPLPGLEKQPNMGYFNWGWNFTVGAHSTQPELAYLLALYCTSPVISADTVSEQEGFFDPFRTSHYTDERIQSAYGQSFLSAHKDSLTHCIPDLYISGQSKYLDALRQQIMVAMSGDATASEALDICARQWIHTTRRLGEAKQREQWQNLKSTYPDRLKHALLSS